MPDQRIERRLRRERRGGWRRAAMLALVILGGYGLLAYLVLPGFWTHYEHQRGLAIAFYMPFARDAATCESTSGVRSRVNVICSSDFLIFCVARCAGR